VNSNAGSEFDLRAGIYYARLELTLTHEPQACRPTPSKRVQFANLDANDTIMGHYHIQLRQMLMGVVLIPLSYII